MLRLPVTRVLLPLLALAPAVGLPASPARADALMMQCFRPGDDGASAECPVNLTQGRDYILRAGGDDGGGDGLVELLRPDNSVVFALQTDGENDTGKEFRAASTATCRIRMTDTEVGAADGSPATMSTGCKGGPATQCALARGGPPKPGVNSTTTEWDWWKATLRRGVTYTFTLSSQGAYTEAVLKTRTGTILARTNSPGATTPGSIRHRATADGAYHLQVSRGQGYSVGLK